MKGISTVNSSSCGTSEGSSIVMLSSFSSSMAEMTEFRLVVNFFTMKQNNVAYTSGVQRKLYFKQRYFLKSV